MTRIQIKHTCGHVYEHSAWGKRIEWLKTKPCPNCAGVATRGDCGAKVSRKSPAPGLVLPPGAIKEYRFASPRRFRFDYAWPNRLVALEVEGACFIAGRHVRPKGIKSDMEKYNLAAERGWLVFRALPENVHIVVEQLSRVLHSVARLGSSPNPPNPPKTFPLEKAWQEGANRPTYLLVRQRG